MVNSNLSPSKKRIHSSHLRSFGAIHPKKENPHKAGFNNI